MTEESLVWEVFIQSKNGLLTKTLEKEIYADKEMADYTKCFEIYTQEEMKEVVFG